jgi:hypothetical protein
MIKDNQQLLSKLSYVIIGPEFIKPPYVSIKHRSFLWSLFLLVLIVCALIDQNSDHSQLKISKKDKIDNVGSIIQTDIILESLNFTYLGNGFINTANSSVFVNVLFSNNPISCEELIFGEYSALQHPGCQIGSDISKISGLEPSDYVNFTTYSNHKYYQEMIKISPPISWSYNWNLMDAMGAREVMTIRGTIELCSQYSCEIFEVVQESSVPYTTNIDLTKAELSLTSVIITSRSLLERLTLIMANAMGSWVMVSVIFKFVSQKIADDKEQIQSIEL